MADFHNRDPLSPAFWDERFEKQFTPWDQGGVPQALRDFRWLIEELRVPGTLPGLPLAGKSPSEPPWVS